MKFYDINGNELKDKDSVDYSTGRYLQDENDYDKYVFSPWDKVPPRPEEMPPQEDKFEKLKDEFQSKVDYLAIMADVEM